MSTKKISNRHIHNRMKQENTQKVNHTPDIYIDDIKNIREELNWRVKLSYTSNITIFPGVTGLASFLLSKDLNADSMYIIASTLSLILSMYVNLQVFNRLIEKKIELYILDIQKKLKDEFGIKTHSWISFLYGEPSRFSIIGHLSLFYQYIFPNIISSVVVFIPFIKVGIEEISLYLILLLLFAVILNGLSYVLIFIFFIYFRNVRKDHHQFYRHE